MDNSPLDTSAPDKIVFNSSHYSMEVVINNGWHVGLGMDGKCHRIKEPSFDVKLTDKYFEEKNWEGLDSTDFCHILFNHFGVNRRKSIGLQRRAEIQDEVEHLHHEHDKILKKISHYQKRLNFHKQLVSTSKKSNELSQALKKLKKANKQLVRFKASCDEHGYPHPPKPCFNVEDSKRGVAGGKRFPGIYFIYEDDKIIYIGKSIDVFSRTLNHLNGTLAQFKGKTFSFLPFPEKDLLYIESFYIGVLRPRENFGLLK